MELLKHIDRFRKNLHFFQEHYPEVYAYLDVDASFVYEDGEINILEAGEKLYPVEYHEKVQKSVEAFLDAPYEAVHIKPSTPSKYMHHRLQYWALASLEKRMERYREQESIKVKELDFIPILAIYGLGLGYHLPKLLNEKEVGITIVLEPDRKNLLASMFVVEWEELMQKSKIYFILGLDARKQAQEVVRIEKANNVMYLYHILLYIHLAKGFEAFQEELRKEVIKEPGSWGFVDDELVSLEHNYHNFVAQRPLYDGRRIQKRVPIFVVGSGPSLDRTIHVIEKYRDNALIFAAGTAIKPLIRAGIAPDYTFALERLKVTYDAFVQAVPMEILSNLSIIASSVVYPPFFTLSNDIKMVPRVPDTGSKIFFELGLSEPVSFQAPTVTNMALAFAAHAGFDEIYLFGVDLGFHDPAYHHSRYTIHNDKGEFEIKKMESFRKVPGNFCDEVYTTEVYELARDKMEMLIQAYPSIRIYNTSDGAKIEGATPLQAEEIVLDRNLKKFDSKEEIEKRFFTGYATKENLEFVQRRYHELVEDIEWLGKLLQEIAIHPERLEKDLFEKSNALYQKLECQVSVERELLYSLVRGTLYHFASFFYSYLSRLPKEKRYDFLLFAQRILMILLKKTKNRVKNIAPPPIMRT